MTKDVKITTKHETTATRMFSQSQLAQMLANTVANQAELPTPHMQGIQHYDNGCRATVRFDRSEAGVTAIVQVFQDHNYVPTVPEPVATCCSEHPLCECP